jgi:hypothetical protein
MHLRSLLQIQQSNSHPASHEEIQESLERAEKEYAQGEYDKAMRD